MAASSATFDPLLGAITRVRAVVRRLSNLCGCFVDTTAYFNALANGDSIVYNLSSVNSAEGEGQLHYGLCQLMPSKIDGEYCLTRGHSHVWRSAAEGYVGLSGEGYVLLDRKTTGESQMLRLVVNTTVYVPGYTIHRAVNTGYIPLTYRSRYPAKAGHDYAAITAKNFQSVIVSIDEKPTLVERQIYLAEYLSQSACPT
jgi:glucose-6-phosphate isomerase, archaeal